MNKPAEWIESLFRWNTQWFYGRHDGQGNYEILNVPILKWMSCSTPAETIELEDLGRRLIPPVKIPTCGDCHFLNPDEGCGIKTADSKACHEFNPRKLP